MEFDMDSLLHFGLAIGAVFQLICILAIIVLPSQDDKKEKEDTSPEESTTTTVMKGPSKPASSGTLTKRNKGREKKLKK